MTDVTPAIEETVEGSDLPRRLRDQVLSTVEERDGVTETHVEEIVAAVEAQYRDSRVDPLDPVGTVSAQSIGEPGTQMSIPGEEPILLRKNGETTIEPIGSFIDTILADHETRSIDDHEVALAPNGVEVLSLRDDEQVTWKPIEEVSRHNAPTELLEFTLESGRTITATKAHSFVTRRANRVVPVTGEELTTGDWLPTIGAFDADSGTDSVDLREYLSVDDYWYTSTLTDGGVTNHPGGPDQVTNKRAAIAAGDLDTNAVYPVQGTGGLPEQFPLDEQTGFVIGAWLAEGSLTDNDVRISNVDPTFQAKIRRFADRFDLTVNEVEHKSGCATGCDIRLNGTVLSDFLSVCCLKDNKKVVPDFAFGATDAFVEGILAGYFSADGNVGDSAVRASSSSPVLIEGISLLLARIGVYATWGENDTSRTLRVPTKFLPRFDARVDLVGSRSDVVATLAERVDGTGPDATDQIPNFGDALETAASAAGIPREQINRATNRQRVGRQRLERLVDQIRAETDGDVPGLAALDQAINGDVIWERITNIETVETDDSSVYDVSVEGLETFTTGGGVVTHNTMNTFHYAGVAEIDVTQGLPRLIELVDARKTPDTPMMTVHLEDEYATDRERAHEVVWSIEATKILALGDISTNVADMVVSIDLNDDTLQERWPTEDDTDEIAAEIAETIQSELGVETRRDGTVVQFGPQEPSYRDLLQLVEELRDIVFKGIEEVSRVVIRKESGDGDDEEFVLYTEGSAFGDVLDIEGVDASRTTCNNIHEIQKTLGIEAAREAIINETMDTLEEQGLGDVNVRHLMLVADIMTNTGDIQSIGRHGISGSKDSVLARAAFEVTVSHLIDAAVYGEVDDLNGVTENVIVGKPIKLGTGDVNLRMRATGEREDSSSD